MFNTLDFCTHYSQSGIIIVNATDHILRIKELDGTIVELPSSVLPKDIPDSYEAKAKEMGTTVKKVCNSSLFAKVDREWMKMGDYLYREIFKSDGVMSIIDNIHKEHKRSHTFIVGTHSAARAFPNEIAEPFYIDEDTYLMESDKFRAYEVVSEYCL